MKSSQDGRLAGQTVTNADGDQVTPSLLTVGIKRFAAAAGTTSSDLINLWQMFTLSSSPPPSLACVYVCVRVCVCACVRACVCACVNV